MVYEVPASKASIKQNRFEFKIGSTKHSIPKLTYMPPEVMADLADIFDQLEDESSDGIERLRALARVADLFGEKGTKIHDAVRGLDGPQRLDLLTAWAEDSGMNLGESEASANS